MLNEILNSQMLYDYLNLMPAYVADLITVMMVLVILSGKREARSTLGWLLLVAFLPYIGAVIYLFFGRRHPYYPPRALHPALSASPVECKDEVICASEEMALTSTITGVMPVMCADLTLFVDAEEKYERLIADMENARERIVLCYYVFRRDETGKKFLEVLGRKAKEGVKTYLLYDGWGAFGLGLFGTLTPYRKMGLKAAPFAPVANPFRMSRINFRNHRKIAVIDGKIGYTGSTNIGSEYLGKDKNFGDWRDLHTRFTGQAAGVLEEIFFEDWRIATGRKVSFPTAVEAKGSIPLHVLPTGPDLTDERLFPLLFAHLTRAERSIEIVTPYLVPNQALVAALSVAARRGLKVRLLLPARSNHPMVTAAGRSYYEELLDGGVKIRQFSDSMLHAKAIIIDGEWALMGSANFDNRSFFLNFEINIALADPSFLNHLEKCFSGWWADSEEVTTRMIKDRGTALNMLDSLCRALSPVL